MTSRRAFLQSTAGALAGLAFVGCDLMTAAPAQAQARRREVMVGGTRVKTVLDWARGEHGFNVPENQRAGLGLFLPGSTEPLDEAEHIGALAGDSDDLRLILAPIKRPQG